MLRALGIAFICCSAMLFMATLGGLAWWAVASGTVQIKGVNQAAPTVSDSHADPVESKLRTIEQATVPTALEQQNEHPSVQIRQASWNEPEPLVAATPMLIPAEPEVRKALEPLRSSRLVRVSATVTTRAYSWGPSGSDTALFPPETQSVVLYFRNPSGNRIDQLPGFTLKALQDSFATTAGDKGELNALISESELLRSGLGDKFSLTADNLSLKMEYQIPGPRRGEVLTLGLPGIGVARVMVARPPGRQVPPRITNLLNGKYQPSPGTPVTGSLSNPFRIYDLLRLRMTSSASLAQTQFFVQRIDAAAGVPGGFAVAEIDKQESTIRPLTVDGAESVGVSNTEFVFSQFDPNSLARQSFVFGVVNVGGETLFTEPIPVSVETDGSGSSGAGASALKAINASSPGDDGFVRPKEVIVSTRLNKLPPDTDVIVRRSDDQTIVATRRITADDKTDGQTDITIGQFSFPSAGPRDLLLEAYQGGRRMSLAASSTVRLPLQVFEDGPTVSFVEAQTFTYPADGDSKIVVNFPAGQKLKSDSVTNDSTIRAHFTLTLAGSNTNLFGSNTTGSYSVAENAITLTIARAAALKPGSYKLTVLPTLKDAAGNPLNKTSAAPDGAAFEMVLTRNEDNSKGIEELVSRTPSEQRGVVAASGPYVAFPEYTPPRSYADGFNPSDKVVTRVARLYYFRDAHRVSQIVNRKVKSYNRAAVDMKQQFADAKKRETDLVTEQRRELERLAVRAAQQAREAENALEEQQQALIEARDDLAAREQQNETLRGLIAKLEDDVLKAPDDKELQRKLEAMKYSQTQVLDSISSGKLQVSQTEARVRGLMARVQTDRDIEIRATGQWESAEGDERRRLEELFRREVAAKTEDPDTYAPAIPDSDDPVEQVSISVVGEGLIQLRGPRKGVNEVHKMINELDAPVGQVKVAIHTVQVNGERGERMEEVVYRIQRYLDHSRFLTLQSAQMLRNAVVKVASERAEQVAGLCPPGMPQQDRAYKYQEAFFGEEFIAELRAMDSEFLRSGNKVLSLHSMDTTSLSNALFLLALAKNDVRQEILSHFMSNVQCQLPQYELEFYQGSQPRPGYKDLPLKERLFSADAHREKMQHRPDFQLLGQNAQFASLRGFFDSDIAGPDTLNPMQREFIRLAQIFKARLVTEVELRQRVMERALIEERIGNVRDAQQEAVEREDDAKRRLVDARAAVTESAQQVRTSLALIQGTVRGIATDAKEIATLSEDVAQGTSKARTTVMAAALNVINAKSEPDQPRFRNDDVTTRSLQQLVFPDTQSSLSGIGLNARLMTLLDKAASNRTTNTPTIDNRFSDSDRALAWNSAFAGKLGLDGIASLQNRSAVLYEEFSGSESNEADWQFNITLNQKQFTIRWDSTIDPTTGLPTGVVVSDWQGFKEILVVYLKFLTSAQGELKQFNHTRTFELTMSHGDQSLEKAKDLMEGSSDRSFGQQDCIDALIHLQDSAAAFADVAQHVVEETRLVSERVTKLNELFGRVATQPELADDVIQPWYDFTREALKHLNPLADKLVKLGVHPGPDGKPAAYLNRYDVAHSIIDSLEARLGFQSGQSGGFLSQIAAYRAAAAAAENLRRPLDHKKFLDMLIDDVEEKFIELVDGTRAQTSNIDNYLKRLGTALEDDFNSQFYNPAFRHVRESSYYYDVSVGQVETTSVVANNRAFAKVSPQATMEFDLPKRDILINEAMDSALAAYNDYGALLGDPNFLSLMKLYSGQSPATTYGGGGPSPYVQEVLPGLPSGTDSQFLTSPDNNVPRVGANLEALIPDPAIYKFETGTGYEIRPVIQPDGQAVVFHFNYMYTTNIREPVRADEKHLGRVKRHFIDTDVVSGNYELREVSTYQVGLKAARTARGVPFLEDVPGVGVLFRPAVNDESSLQENIVLSQTVIHPTLFDLMGLRWAPAVADLDSLSLRERDFVTRNREKFLRNEVFDYSSLQVDDFMRIPEAERRGDLYRTQETIPDVHPNQYQGPGMNIRNGTLVEDYSPDQFQTPSTPIPGRSEDATFPLEPEPRTPILFEQPMMVPDVPYPHGGGGNHQGRLDETGTGLRNNLPPAGGTHPAAVGRSNLHPGNRVTPAGRTIAQPGAMRPTAPANPTRSGVRSGKPTVPVVRMSGQPTEHRDHDPRSGRAAYSSKSRVNDPATSLKVPDENEDVKSVSSESSPRKGLSRWLPGRRNHEGQTE
jgi:hypothetical protein